MSMFHKFKSSMSQDDIERLKRGRFEKALNLTPIEGIFKIEEFIRPDLHGRNAIVVNHRLVHLIDDSEARKYPKWFTRIPAEGEMMRQWIEPSPAIPDQWVEDFLVVASMLSGLEMEDIDEEVSDMLTDRETNPLKGVYVHARHYPSFSKNLQEMMGEEGYLPEDFTEKGPLVDKAKGAGQTVGKGVRAGWIRRMTEAEVVQAIADRDDADQLIERYDLGAARDNYDHLLEVSEEDAE